MSDILKELKEQLSIKVLWLITEDKDHEERPKVSEDVKTLQMTIGILDENDFIKDFRHELNILNKGVRELNRRLQEHTKQLKRSAHELPI